MLIEGIIIGIVTGYLRGGRLRRLANLNLKAYYLLFIAVVIEITLNYVLINHNDIILEAYSLIAVVIQYLLIFVFVGLNLNKPYTWLIGTGVLLNFIVIVANFGAMPVSSQILSLASPSKKMTLLGEGKFYTYKLVESGVLLWFLGDIIRISFPLRHFISIGDILLSVGVLLLIQKSMTEPEYDQQGVA